MPQVGLRSSNVRDLQRAPKGVVHFDQTMTLGTDGINVGNLNSSKYLKSIYNIISPPPQQAQIQIIINVEIIIYLLNRFDLFVY